MNNTLKKYKQLIESIESSQDIADFIIYGDWGLLTVERMTLYELAEEQALSEDEKQIIATLDRQFKAHLSKDQLSRLSKMETEMPIMQWWG